MNMMQIVTVYLTPIVGCENDLTNYIIQINKHKLVGGFQKALSILTKQIALLPGRMLR